MSAADPWFLHLRPRPAARLRLFCFHHAGAGASVYHQWPSALRPEVEVLPVQLPGRENRYREPLFDRLDALVPRLTDALEPMLDRPYAFFGYSLGSLLSYEVVRELRRRGRTLPAQLFLAAKPAVHFPKAHPPIAGLPQNEFLERIRQVYAPPETAWDVPDLMALMLPILRADLSLYDTYRYVPEEPLSCPIQVFGGEDDRASPHSRMEAWREHTTAECELRMFPGGHFFILQQGAPLQRAVDRTLGRRLSTLP